MIQQITAFIFNNWLDWLFMAFMAVTGYGYRKVIKVIADNQNKDDSVRKGVQSLLRDRIIHSHNKYSKLGYCPVYAKENVERMYDSYHKLGGNNVVTGMKEDLLAMPTVLCDEEKEK